jgi:hypothetical protein
VDFEGIWHVVGISLVLSLAVLIGVLICAPKDVNYYYLSQGANSGASACVYAHWTWHGDEKAFCSDDYNKALDFAARANNTVKK